MALAANKKDEDNLEEALRKLQNKYNNCRDENMVLKN